jgi:hypothetical protein
MSFAIKMTKAEALRIQGEQLDYYCRNMTEEQQAELRRRIAAETTADQLEDGVEYSVATVNRCIPRGTDIEREAIRDGVTRAQYAEYAASLD